MLIFTDAFFKKSSVTVNDVGKFTDYFTFTDAFLKTAHVNVSDFCKFTNYFRFTNVFWKMSLWMSSMTSVYLQTTSGLQTRFWKSHL